MFVLCASRYVTPVKFTLFAPHVKLAHKKFVPFMHLLTCTSARRRFVPQIQPRRSLANPFKFINGAGQICNFNPSKATISAWLCRDEAYLRSSKPCGKHRECTCRCHARAPLCAHTSHLDPRPLMKRYPSSPAPADQPRSPRRHMGFS